MSRVRRRRGLAGRDPAALQRAVGSYVALMPLSLFAVIIQSINGPGLLASDEACGAQTRWIEPDLAGGRGMCDVVCVCCAGGGGGGRG